MLFCVAQLFFRSLSYILLIYIVFSDSGATNPEYIVTADDVDKLIAVECIPMDEIGHQVFYVIYTFIDVMYVLCGEWFLSC